MGKVKDILIDTPLENQDEMSQWEYDLYYLEILKQLDKERQNDQEDTA